MLSAISSLTLTVKPPLQTGKFSSVPFSSVRDAIPHLHMYSAARRPPHAARLHHHGYSLGSGFWVLTPAAAAKGRWRQKGEEGGWVLVERDARRGWASCERRGGVGPAAGGVVVVRGSWFVLRSSCHREQGTDLCSCTPVLKEIMSMSMSISGIESRVPSICSTGVTRKDDRRIASHRIVCCLRCLRRISTFFSVLCALYDVRTPSSLFFLSFSFFLFFSFFSFLLRPGRRALLYSPLPSPPISRLVSLNARALWLARSRNTPIWSSN